MKTLGVLLNKVFSLRLLVVVAAVWVAVAGDALPFLSYVDRLILTTFGDITATSTAGQLSADTLRVTVERLGLVEPQWSAAVLRGALMAVAVYLVVVVPALGAAVALPVTLLAAATLIVIQAALLVYQSTWLPLGATISLLLCGYCLMLFWLQPQRAIESLTDNVRDARLHLGKVLLRNGQPEEALEALADCPVDDDSLELQYDIAIQQERKRQYDKASATLRQIVSQRKNYRDAGKRLEALVSLSGESASAGGGGFDSTRTLVLPEQSVSRPTLGRYEIEREIGRGAMGVVYLGKDPKIARTVAIKTLSYQAFEPAELKDLKDRFFREAEAAGRLSHPAIVTVYDVGEEADLAFIAMDYAQGRPLSAFCKPDGLLPIRKVLTLLAQVADALDYAHDQNIIHRDIKPGNIIYNTKNGDVKITDFGIAKISDDSRTRTGSVMGSPLYMSPEQLKGQKVTGASDTYSLGITLYKLVTGETPYQGETLAALTYQILNKRPRSAREFNKELPNGVVRLINKAIQKEPAKRFASASAMAEALRRQAAKEPEGIA